MSGMDNNECGLCHGPIFEPKPACSCGDDPNLACSDCPPDRFAVDNNGR